MSLSALALATAAAAAPPRLTVLVTVEQLRSDALAQFAANFGPGGFRLLTDGGAVVSRCRFDLGVTLAAPAAATLATGTPPAEHGVVANRWYDAGQQRVIRAADGEDASPAALRGSTLADELLLAYPERARVVAVGGSPTTALLAGRRPLGCYWRGSGRSFITSRFFGGAVPVWLTQFNGSLNRDPVPSVWRALGGRPDSPPLRKLDGPSAEALYRASPFAVEDLLKLAAEAVRREKLGRSGAPDLLIVNISAPAILGLETGASSPLMRDMMARLDRSLAQFLRFLDDEVGLIDTAIALTGLHGAPPQRDALKAAGLPAGAVSGEEVASAIQKALGEDLGAGARLERYVYPFVYLNEAARTATPDRRVRVLRTAGEAAMAIEGVAGYYSPEASSVSAAMAEKLERSWRTGRSGDLMLVYEPYFTERYGDGRGTSSGSPYRYDSDVPLILFGHRFRPGVYEGSVPATSIAPTLSAVLGISAPSLSEGRVLGRLLASDSAPPVGPPTPPIE